VTFLGCVEDETASEPRALRPSAGVVPYWSAYAVAAPREAIVALSVAVVAAEASRMPTSDGAAGAVLPLPDDPPLPVTGGAAVAVVVDVVVCVVVGFWLELVVEVAVDDDGVVSVKS
jgi:hypothetical protein